MKFHKLFAVASMILGRGECATQREVKSTCRFDRRTTRFNIKAFYLIGECYVSLLIKVK